MRKHELKPNYTILIIWLLTISHVSYTQAHIEVSPLTKFLQTNTDTTIIFYYMPSAWVKYTDQLIISKTDSTLIYSTYINPYKQYSLGHKMMKDQLSQKFADRERLFENTLPDTNNYFQPREIKPSSKEIIWRQIMNCNPWLLKDSITPNVERKCWVYDAGAVSLLLITKNRISQVIFYEPFELETCEPGDKNRQKILRIEKIFRDAFK